VAALGSLLRRTSRAVTLTDEVTLFYASDLHASESCWRKFLATPKFYGANVLILGGDLAGKAFVPIVDEGAGRWSATFLGEEQQLDEEGVTQLERQIRFNGLYPYRSTPDEVQRLSEDAAYVDEVFAGLLVDELRRWCDLADERLGDDVTALVMCGNDDPLALDEPLKQSSRLTFCDEQIVEAAGHEVLSFSYANPTPWDSPRELEEDALYARISTLADQLSAPEGAIFNLHVPPHDSGLDTATQLDEDFKPVMVGGNPVPIAAGSTAVRELIERYQPMLSLHGHIHESRGATTIGRTVVVNPGSDYASGRIDGCLATVAPSELRRYQLVSG
jgi:Icc-related predicted phosphoesterase